MGTGGTIAGIAPDPQYAMGGYKPGVLNVNALLKQLPRIAEVAHITAEQIANIDSKDMTKELWYKLSEHVNMQLRNELVDGVVITHGTDTLEETAYFLNLTVKSRKPVVLTAAMRPSNALSADGPLNLQNAVVVAANEASFGQGVLIVMNDHIYSAHDVTKTNTHSVDTFRSIEFGALGWVQDKKVQFERSIARTHKHTIDSQFNIDKDTDLPCVEIIMSYSSPSPDLINALVEKNHIKGLVIAGTGNGTFHVSLGEALNRAVSRGVAVVRSSRVCYGHTTHEERDNQIGFLSAGTLNPYKARILLMFILGDNIVGHAERQRIFDTY